MPRTASLLSRDNLRRLDPTVFEKAAEKIRKGEETYTCNAITDAAAARGLAGAYSYDYRDPYREAFGPQAGVKWVDSSYSYSYPVGHPFWNRSKTAERQNDRYTSLLMMAAMVRTAKASRGVKKAKKEHLQERAALTGPGSFIGLSF